MPRSYRQISQYEKEIIELYNQRMTLRAIAEKLGFTHKQVQEFKTRYNKSNE
ncbi:MAG: helix-turn-helix domain-containing protein [Eubacterium coprostanoligenes]|nr:helix-turn-helix domain-containing protein [Eubacterium coprostanoligenes]